MDPIIRKALTWTMLGMAFLLFVFTLFDLNSGEGSLSSWLSLVGWAVVMGICGWILSASRSEDLGGEPSDDAELTGGS